MLVFSPLRTGMLQPSKARGRTCERLPWPFNEHLEEPSYSFHDFFSARASGLRH